MTGAGVGLPALRQALARYRVLLAAGLLAASVTAGLAAVAPAAAATTSVVVVTRDLPGGVVLEASDLRLVDVPLALAPTGVLRDPAGLVGRMATGPVRAGELLTDARLLGASLLGPAATEVAVPVRFAEPGTAAMVRAGDRVDVLSASPQGGASAAVVAGGLRVLSVPAVDGEGALVVLAVTRSVAARLAAEAVTGRLSLALLGAGA